MKYRYLLVLAASVTGTAFGGMPAPLPEFKTAKQLAVWRAEKAAEPSVKATTDEHAFYTGKPYVDSSGGYAFKYRSYNPELARWTSEDPSGFPDGANCQVFVPAPSFMFDPNGLSWENYYQFTSLSWKTVVTETNETNANVSLTNVSVAVGQNSNGPTGQIQFGFSITTNSTVISTNSATTLTNQYSMDLPTGSGWEKSGEYTKYTETTQESRIENNTPLGDNRFQNVWYNYTNHMGYVTWQKWVE
jgi:RHS repeat-associated protein